MPNIEVAVGDLADAVDTLLVPRFASVAARAAAITAPAFGSLAAVTATGELYMYNGSVWVSARPRSVWKTATQNIASTTVANDNHITMALEANSTYQWKFVANYSNSTTGAADIKSVWTLPAGAASAPSFRNCIGMSPNSVAARTNSTGTWRSSGFSTEVSYGTDDTSAGSPVVFLEEGLLLTSATAGNMVWQWAQAAATGTLTVSSAQLTMWKVG